MRYKVGDKIHIAYMEGEPKYEGRRGVINYIDDAGQLHGTWGGCAVVPNVDIVYKLTSCCLCGQDFIGYGNNAMPLNKGVCCDLCNLGKVIPARIKQATEGSKSGK